MVIILGQVSSKELYESFFEGQFKEGFSFQQNWNIHPGDNVNILTTEKPHEFHKLNYGLIPFWTSNEKQLFQAPIDGGMGPEPFLDQVKKRIIYIPEFRKPIRETRCVIPMDYFIIVKDGEARLFFHKERELFSIAGIYDKWKKTITSTLYEGFSILTLPAVGVFKELGCIQMPLILKRTKSKYWLKNSLHLTDITKMMKYFPEEKINGYQVDFEKVTARINDRSLTIPQSKYLQPLKKQSNQLIDYIRKNKYRKGVIHNFRDQEQRIWRGNVNGN